MSGSLGLMWEGQQSMDSSVGTDTGPSLAVFNNLLYAAWKGGNGDETIWYSSFDGTSWAPQQAMPAPIATSTRPSLTAFKALGVFSAPLLYAAWKGGGSDERIWYSSFDGSSWAAQQAMPSPIASSVGPSLAPYFAPDTEANLLYAAWKGGGSDESIWFSALNGTDWFVPGQTGFVRPPFPVQGVLPSPIASSVGPSLAVLTTPSMPLYAAWKGGNGDERIWFSGFDGTSWSPQQALPDPIASSVGPSLAVFNNVLYAVWKGAGDDERIWYSTFDGTVWGIPPLFYLPVQKQLPDPIASSVGPSLAAFNNRLYAAWKGGNGDTRIWWTSATERRP